MSMFKELLAIKSFRETKAELAVTRQRGVLADAVAHQEAAEQSLEQFRQFAVRQENKLYEDLCARMVLLRDIEDVQLAVASLRSKESQHEQALRQAEADRQSQENKLIEEKQVRIDATRMREKFLELAEVHAAEVLKEGERKEDAEMEEVSETRREREDWGASEEIEP
jgi:type III secretion protein O